MSVPRWLLWVVAISLAVVALLWFLGSMSDDADAGNDDPVSRAKAAGWTIDPRAEQAMRKLPPESALYDVSGQPPREVHWMDSQGEQLPMPPEAVAEKRRMRDEMRARGLTQADVDAEAEGDRSVAMMAAASAPNCTLRASVPYKAAGMMQGDATHECYQIVNRHELYGQLIKWSPVNQKWVQIATRSAGRNGLQKIETHARVDCATTPYRNWRHHADAYVEDRFGNWWTESRDYEQQWQCNN